MSTPAQGVYRLPGRQAEPGPVPRPSARRLLSPLVWGVGSLLALALPLVALNALFDPHAENGFREARFVPWVERAQDGVMLALLGAIVLTVFVLVRRVVPIWGGLSRRRRILYVASVLALQAAATLGAELAVFMSRGGLHLFEPSLRGSTTLADGRTAHVYGGSFFGASYDVYVAEPFAPVMHKKLHVSRRKLEAVVPTVRVGPNGEVELVDAKGQRLASEASSLQFLFGGC